MNQEKFVELIEKSKNGNLLENYAGFCKKIELKNCLIAEKYNKC